MVVHLSICWSIYRSFSGNFCCLFCYHFCWYILPATVDLGDGTPGVFLGVHFSQLFLYIFVHFSFAVHGDVHGTFVGLGVMEEVVHGLFAVGIREFTFAVFLFAVLFVHDLLLYMIGTFGVHAFCT